MKLILGMLLALMAFSETALAENGNMMDSLQVTEFYINGPAVYVAFNPASMPEGCYARRGGMLLQENPRYKELYSEIMALRYIKGRRGYVIFEFNPERDPNHANWWDCTITGLYFQE